MFAVSVKPLLLGWRPWLINIMFRFLACIPLLLGWRPFHVISEVRSFVSNNRCSDPIISSSKARSP